MREQRGEEVPVEVQSSLNLGLDIRIPSTYISDDQQRLRAYKRIADVKEESQAARVIEELGDRYGPVPEEVINLVRFSLLKSLAERTGVESIDRRQGFANIKFHQQSKIDPFRLMNLVRSLAGAQFTPAGVLKLPLEASKDAAQLLAQITKTLQKLTVDKAEESAEKARTLALPRR